MEDAAFHVDCDDKPEALAWPAVCMSAVLLFMIYNVLKTIVLQTVLQKAVFCFVKDGFSRCERRPFAVPFAVFCKTDRLRHVFCKTYS